MLDRQAESFVDPAAWQSNFEQSLLNNILFEKAVLVPDVFFFISRGLMGHFRSAMLNGQTSLLEAGVSQGIIIPAFREIDCAGFTQAYTTIRDTGIRGLLPYEENLQHITSRLDTAVRRSELFRSIPWPASSVGASFEENLVRFFQPPGDQPPLSSPLVQRIWEITGPWRYGALNQARGQRATGFRRGDYMAALGESVGINDRPIDDISQLFPAARSSQENLALQVLCFWMNECYAYSQARSFGVSPNFPNFHPEYSIATLAALEPAGEDSPSDAAELTITARLPPRHVLLTMDTEAFVRLRESPSGQDYFAATDYWHANPMNEGAQRAVALTFEYYADAIRRIAYKRDIYKETFVNLRLAAYDGPARRLATAATAAMGAAAVGVTGLHSLPYIMAGGVAFATYVWAADRARAQNHTLRASAELSLSE
ncbi:hypothetical protein [Herbidospora mongoliensis]|uniref:hypothetical protein n=1 Tax=Herbidospora mongoliensis TaxID=688067 RepID=UPI0012FC2BBC|nr:hypothetical protein [Herbidospora mongoliensis]